MRSVQRVVLFLCPVLLFGLGFLKVLRGFLSRFAAHSGFRMRLESLLDSMPHQTLHVVYLLCFLLPILLLVLWFLIRRESQVLKIATLAGGSSLSIRQSAVNRYLHECLKELPFVRNVRVQASTTADGSLAVQVRVWISATQQIDSLQQRMLVRVREVVQSSFGVQKFIEPEILIEEVAAGGASFPDEVKPAEKKFDTAQSGPVAAASLLTLQASTQPQEVPAQDDLPEEPKEEAFNSAFFETIREGVERNSGGAVVEPASETPAPADTTEPNGADNTEDGNAQPK